MHQRRLQFIVSSRLFIFILGLEICFVQCFNDFYDDVHTQKGYVVNDKGCRIPNLSPFEPSMKRYITEPKPIVCEYGTALPLIKSNSNTIFVDSKALPHYYDNIKSIQCCWRNVQRSDQSDSSVVYDKNCQPFKEDTQIHDEFIKVECQLRNKSIYQDYFAFVPRKPEIETRCHKQLEFETSVNKEKAKTIFEKKLSVLLVGLDSVSRLNFHRLMPRTLNKLKEIGAVELNGYHKVADNTYPNLVPVLSGYSVTEFENLCLSSRNDTYDKCPLIWNAFSARGYRTIFAEDWCYVSLFNHNKAGFRKAPTDYYLRTFYFEMESKIGNTKIINGNLCVGTRLNFENLLHYTTKAAEEFADDPYFGFFWQTSLTHDDISYPQLGDSSYHDFLENLTRKNLLRNTALIFMSDHGMRFGRYRQTYQGRFEDSLPLIFFYFPDWWKEMHREAWQNLQNNNGRLTTHFDLHETLRDILEPNRMVVPIKNGPAPKVNATVRRGISLFEKIPNDRTCDSAGIPNHWCMCQTRHNVSVKDPKLPKVLSFFNKTLNNILNKYSQCSKLKILKLLDSKRLVHIASTGDTKTNNDKYFQQYWTVYTVTVKMAPGGAIFEGSIDYYRNGTMNLSDSISRLNAYGNQSNCVDDFQMRLYCYCLPKDKKSLFQVVVSELFG